MSLLVTWEKHTFSADLVNRHFSEKLLEAQRVRREVVGEQVTQPGEGGPGKQTAV